MFGEHDRLKVQLEHIQNQFAGLQARSASEWVLRRRSIHSLALRACIYLLNTNFGYALARIIQASDGC